MSIICHSAIRFVDHLGESMVTHGKGRNFMVFSNLAFFTPFPFGFFWTWFGFFLKRCLTTLSLVCVPGGARRQWAARGENSGNGHTYTRRDPKHCFLPLLLVSVMKCVKMYCYLPHNPYCCLLPSPVCLLHLLICTCINQLFTLSPPICVMLMSIVSFYFIFVLYFVTICLKLLFWLYFGCSLTHCCHQRSLFACPRRLVQHLK